MKRGVRILAVVVTSLLLIELGSLLVNRLFLSAEDRQVFQLHSEAHYKSINWMKLYTQYHPYLAYERKVGGSADSLFLADPQTRTEVFRVGILGGSLAEELVSEVTPQGVQKFFATELAQRGWTGKVEVLVLAAGAARQPRQLIGSVLYKDEFDLFLSFEGINEMLTGHATCAPAYFPLAIHGYDPDFKSKYKTPLRLTQVVYNVGHAGFHSWLGSTSTGQAFWYRLEPLIFSTFKYFEKAQSTNLQQSVCPDRPDGTMLDAVAWHKFLNRQHEILNGDGKIRLITFLQPSQYLPGAKPLTSEEENIFSAVSKQTQTHFAETYAAGLSRVRLLMPKHSGIVDFTMIFKDDGATLYKDDCCHLNSDGYQKLWTSVTAEVRARLAKSYAH